MSPATARRRWEKDYTKTANSLSFKLLSRRENASVIGLNNLFLTYHRTLATIINQLFENRFQIQHISRTYAGRDQEQWHAEPKDLQHRPVLLFIKAQKIR